MINASVPQDKAVHSAVKDHHPSRITTCHNRRSVPCSLGEDVQCYAAMIINADSADGSIILTIWINLLLAVSIIISVCIAVSDLSATGSSGNFYQTRNRAKCCIATFK